MLGTNMFAYCNNNPVSNADSEGGRPYNVNVNMTDSGPLDGQSKAKIRAREEYNYYYNKDEKKVLDASLFEFYKGKLCIKLPIGDNAFSFGMMFIGDGVDESRDAIETIRHEYGHTVQLEELGVFKYYIHVAIPSVHSSLTGVYGVEYYSQPWEYGADKAGNVKTRHGGYYNNAEETWTVWWASVSS